MNAVGPVTNHQNVKKRPQSHEKNFCLRNSMLIDLFENIHVRTVYHLFVAIFIGLFVNTTVYDYIKKGEVVLGLKLIRAGFGGIHVALVAWLAYFSVACVSCFLFKFWARKRIFLKLKNIRLWDFLWTLVTGTYYTGSFLTAGYVVTKFKLSPASSAFVVIEQTRILMKVHSFVRENAPKVVTFKQHTDSDLPLPQFSHLLYFLFAPTLIYRDSYPRREKTDWTFVCFRFLECVGVIFFLSFVTDRFLNPSIEDFGIRKFTVNEIVLCIFENTITGVFILLPTFFLILHSWQNMFAEITRFGDRLFYRDWWTCTDFSCYFRKWNIIVQEWLYLYVYRDFNENVFRGNSTLSKLAVFVISAVVHEWILAYMFGFFFPLLFFEFLFLGSLFNFLLAPKNTFFNILFWYAISLGMATLVTMYGIEFYARANAPIANPTFKDRVIPRFLTCDCIASST